MASRPAKNGQERLAVQGWGPRERVVGVPEEKGASLFLYDSSGTLERGTNWFVKRYDWRKSLLFDDSSSSMSLLLGTWNTDEVED